MNSVLRASVQHNDWKGSVAADDADGHNLRNWLQVKDLLSANEALVAITFSSSSLVDADYISAKALVADLADFDAVADQLQTEQRLNLKERSVDVPLSEFFCMFKRFEIVLTPEGVDLDDRA